MGMTQRFWNIVLGLLLCVVIVLIGVMPSTASTEPVLDVVASIAPLADMVYQVGGGRVAVHQIVPSGASPHTYEPIPSDLVSLSRADALFMIGLGYEKFIDPLIQEAGTRIPVFEVNEGIPVIYDEKDHHHSQDDEKDHHHSQGNPHIWLSLRNAQLMVEQIAEILGTLDPEGKAQYLQNAQEYQKELASLDEWFTEKSLTFTSREFVAAHAAWPYLAKDYGLHQAGSIERFPGREPTPREIRDLIESIQATGIRVVFAEPQLSQKAAVVLAEEAGVKMAILDPLGSFPDKPYLTIMRKNLETIAEVLR
ncbi:MAG TPA: metal ABC transporter substrate-binding protein [Atribacteraceae bacterium]|nr:metal ABC transporter substrate-binding protein [Atribacteraceae bacterium]